MILLSIYLFLIYILVIYYLNIVDIRILFFVVFSVLLLIIGLEVNFICCVNFVYS